MPRSDPDAELLAIAVRGERNGLIEAETQVLTGGQPDDDGVARCDRIELIGRAAYVQRGIRVIERAPTLGALCEIVAATASTIPSDRFRIGVHDPSRRSATPRTDAILAMANVIDGRPDLGDPLHQFVIVVRPDEVVFGSVGMEADLGYRAHDTKPWTTSSSLDSRFSRALVNLVPDARSILDPCCGAGSIVVEAASLGIEAHGVDWKTPLVGMTRENLAHFGYSGTATKADARTLDRRVDAVITDLPYGHGITADEQTTRAILEQCAGLAPVGVFVAPADFSGWLEHAGYTDIEVHTVMKRRGFTRWVHVCRSAVMR